MPLPGPGPVGDPEDFLRVASKKRVTKDGRMPVYLILSQEVRAALEQARLREGRSLSLIAEEALRQYFGLPGKAR